MVKNASDGQRKFWEARKMLSAERLVELNNFELELRYIRFEGPPATVLANCKTVIHELLSELNRVRWEARMSEKIDWEVIKARAPGNCFGRYISQQMVVLTVAERDALIREVVRLQQENVGICKELSTLTANASVANSIESQLRAELEAAREKIESREAAIAEALQIISQSSERRLIAQSEAATLRRVGEEMHHFLFSLAEQNHLNFILSESPGAHEGQCLTCPSLRCVNVQRALTSWSDARGGGE